MTIAEIMPDIEQLPREQQLELASEIWDRNTLQTPSPESEEAINQLLQARLREFEKNPDAGIRYEDMRQKYGASK